MPSMLAPPRILSALAFSVEEDSDPYLKFGTHIRVFAGLGASFPLGPMIVRGFRSRREASHCLFYAQNSRGEPAGEDFGDDKFLDATLVLNDPPGLTTTSIQIDQGVGGIEWAELIDPMGRVVGVRDRGPFVFSGPVLHRLRVRGWGRLRITKLMAPYTMAKELQSDPRSILSVLSLPIKEELPWYFGVKSHDDGIERVTFGAPKQLNPMDVAFSKLLPQSEDDERFRIEAALAALKVKDGLDGLVRRLVATGDELPWEQRERMPDLGTAPNGKPKHANIGRLGTLQLAAADPGMARYLGLADRFKRLPGEEWDTLTIFGLFAFAPAEFERRGVDLSSIMGFQPNDNLVKVYATNLDTAVGGEFGQVVRKLAKHAVDAGLAIAPLATTLDPVPQWLPPNVKVPLVFERRWQGIKDNTPSYLYRASFAYEELPMVSQFGMARGADGKWMPRNERLEAPDRAVPGVFGTEIDAAPRLAELGGTSLKPAALLSDYDIDANAVQTEFAVWASDAFGRFPEKAETFQVAPPPRPSPPAPVMRFHFERRPGVIPPGQSAGTVTVRIAVPTPLPAAEPFTEEEVEYMGAAVVVPRLDKLAPGSFDITSLRLGIDDLESDPIELWSPGIIERVLDVPNVVAPITRFAVVGQYTDSKGNESDIGSASFEVRNFTPPVKINTGVGLLWSSDPGAGPEVEVKLRWNAPSGSQHRVYLADQAGMEIKATDLVADLPATPSRGLVAVKGVGRVGIKKHFRMLTDPPLVAESGVVTLNTQLPRSLETVQFLRVVPLGSDGEEFNFSQCGIVAIAVPESRRPAPPRLDAAIDSATGKVLLTVSTDAVDEVVLNRDEPGLFDPARPGKSPPVANIRRAAAGVADPIYARQVGQPEPMTRDPATKRYAAFLHDDNGGDGLEPFVSYVYWAEWRMPAERRLPADFQELSSDITPVDPAAARDRPRPKSPPSAPRAVMWIPPDPPAGPLAADVEVTQSAGATPQMVALKIDVANPPQAHKLAAKRYRLAVWSKWNIGAIEPIREAGGVPLEGNWPSIEHGTLTTEVMRPAGAITLTLLLAFVDPADRLGAVTSVPVPQA